MASGDVFFLRYHEGALGDGYLLGISFNGTLPERGGEGRVLTKNRQREKDHPIQLETLYIHGILSSEAKVSELLVFGKG